MFTVCMHCIYTYVHMYVQYVYVYIQYERMCILHILHYYVEAVMGVLCSKLLQTPCLSIRLHCGGHAGHQCSRVTHHIQHSSPPSPIQPATVRMVAIASPTPAPVSVLPNTLGCIVNNECVSCHNMMYCTYVRML